MTPSNRPVGPTYDDLIIGSGLTALGTILGLPAGNRILVIAGAHRGRLQYYDYRNTVPCAYLGYGGLGRFWHSVIPTGQKPRLAGDDQEFRELFRQFYPDAATEARLGEDWLFVPRQPIRSNQVWERERARRGDRLTILNRMADRFDRRDRSVAVMCDEDIYSARRLWLAAGPLHSPALVERSVNHVSQRRYISDHIISYVGQIDRRAHPHIAAPNVERSRDGVWLQSMNGNDGKSLFTLKPARFSYLMLDHGIAQRAAFGLPTGGALRKIAKSASLGLISEALFNKFGLFPDAPVLSAYAQTHVRDAYEIDTNGSLRANGEAIDLAVTEMHRKHPWASELVASRRRDLFINAIHLHHSLDLDQLQAADINRTASIVQVVDGSPVSDIGGEHHSFKLMVSAFARAKRLAA